MNRFTTKIGFVLILVSSLSGQERSADSPHYLWPTDASKYLTSAFCEYRPRRFHAGIDIKTWGKTGYNVFAIRPGYVWRISVSPYGYGKALYLKLDTGEIAVYAHLSEFADHIEELVTAEQQRLGRYRVNMFLRPGVIPVQQGEIIALTGRTGIGAPHLHFEIRDAANRPMNPLSKGYRIPDNVSPIIQQVSFTPLDETSEVDGDYKPLLVTPQWSGPAEYTLPAPVTIWGNVGVGLAAYDKSANARNRYGLYSLKLYVDDVLRFEYRFDQMTFRENSMVELERDYRLSRRRHGRFYKLYKDKFNRKDIYQPNRTWAGVLKSAPLNAIPNLETDRSGSIRNHRELEPGLLFPGTHELRIEAADYMGNVSTVYGHFKVGAMFDIRPIITQSESGYILEDMITYDLREVEDVEAFSLIGRRWRALPIDRIPEIGLTDEKGGDGTLEESRAASSTRLLIQTLRNTPIIKIVGQDLFGVYSYPYFHVDTRENITVPFPDLDVEFDFYDRYVRLHVFANNILPDIPDVILYPSRDDSMRVGLHQKELREYVGRIGYDDLHGDSHPLRISGRGINGEPFVVRYEFKAEEVRPKRKGRFDSEDGKFAVSFWTESLYEPLRGYVETDSVESDKEYEFLSRIYRVEPRDVLLRDGAMIQITYPDSIREPEKLGVYYKTGRDRWVFIDNRHDRSEQTISARVLSFEAFALIRDDVPPEITAIRPGYNIRLNDTTPEISVHVQDRLSGIASEEDIEIRLNGKKLIAEYDPERDRVTYEAKEPLPSGRYELVVRAVDKCGNRTVKESVFWIN